MIRTSRILVPAFMLAVTAGIGSAMAAEVVLRAQTALPRQHDLSKSFLKHFRHEFVHHIEHKQCLVQGPSVEPRWGRAGAAASPSHPVGEAA